MTVRLLVPYGKYPANSLFSGGASIEAELLRTFQADTNLALGTAFVVPVDTHRAGPVAIESTGGKDLLKADGRTLLDLTAAQALVSGAGKASASQSVRSGKSLVGWTLSNAGAAASTLALIANSPIDGLPALRLTIPAGTATVDLNATGMGLANHTAGLGKLAIHLYIEDELTIKQVRPYVGIAGLGRNMDRTYRISNDNDFRINGHHIIDIHPDVATANSVLTTDTVDDCRLRIDVQPTGNATVVWVGGIYVPQPTNDRWLVVTFDDADVSMYTRTHAELSKRNLRATFGMNWDDGIVSGSPRTGVGAPGALFLTAAQVAEMNAYGHDLASHNTKNDAYPSVLPTSAQPSDADRLTYCDRYRFTRNLMRSLGYTRALGYHPFVQGRFDGALLAAMQAHGVTLARSAGVEGNVEPFMLQRQGVVWMRKLGNGASLAQAQAWCDTARVRAQDVVLMGHALADTSSDSITWAQSNFAALLDYALASGMRVGSVSEWAAARGITV